MRDIDFTVAVAIYNVEAYLKECIDSIIGQLDDRTQLILVDDGSTDGSGEICDLYAQKDHRIEVIHQKNGGLSAARNTAIERALGKWIVFVDGDDRLAENAMATMKHYFGEAAQLVIFDYIAFDENGYGNDRRTLGSCVFDTPEQLAKFRAAILYFPSELQEKFSARVFVTSWGKMWRMSYLREHGYRFDTAVRRGEDNAFSFAASRNMSRICVTDECVYEYRQNQTGIMRRYEPKTAAYFRILLSVIAKDMLASGEAENELLRDSFRDLCADGVCYSFLQTVLHRACPWRRKERIAWLKALSGEDFVKEAEKHHCASKPKRLLLWLLEKKAYGSIDLGGRVLRLLRFSGKRRPRRGGER